MNRELIRKLLEHYPGSDERCGFILTDGAVVEAENICLEPSIGFAVSDADLDRYIDDAVGTWHTHPNGTNILGVDDYAMMRGMPDLIHFIIGAEGVAAYSVDRDQVLNHELPE